MKDSYWIQIIVSISAFTLGLLGILFTWMKSRQDKNEEKAIRDLKEFRDHMYERLRTLRHEQRDMDSKITGLYTMFVEAVKEMKRK